MRYYTYREKRKRCIIFSVVFAIAIIVLWLLLCKSCSNGSTPVSPDEDTTEIIHTGDSSNNSQGQFIVTDSGDNNKSHTDDHGDTSDVGTHNRDDNGQIGDMDTSNNKTTEHGDDNRSDNDTYDGSEIAEEVGSGNDNGNGNTSPKTSTSTSPQEPTTSGGNDWQPSPPNELNYNDGTNGDDSNNPNRRVGERPKGGLFPSPGITGNKTVLIILFIFLLIAFLVSNVFSSGGLVIWVSTFDKFLVIAAAFLFFISCLFDNGVSPLPPFAITLRYISGTLMLISIALSIFVNFPNVLFIILSVLDKIFVFYCVMIFSFIGIVIIIVYIMLSAAHSSQNND